jgi:hypothetical protein
MKRIVNCVALLLLMTFSQASFAAQPIPATWFGDSLVLKPTVTIRSSNKEIQKLIGRKLTLKEKFALWVGKKYSEVDEAASKKANSQALIAFLLSLAGFFIIPLFPSIAAIVISSRVLQREKENPGLISKNKALAQIAQILGIIGVAIVVVAIVVLLAYLGGVRR